MSASLQVLLPYNPLMHQISYLNNFSLDDENRSIFLPNLTELDVNNENINESSIPSHNFCSVNIQHLSSCGVSSNQITSSPSLHHIHGLSTKPSESKRRKSVPIVEVSLGLGISLITANEVATLISSSVMNHAVVDVRSGGCFDSCHINGAINACCSTKLLTRRAVQLVESNLKPEVTLVILYNESGNSILEKEPVAGLINKLRQNEKLEIKMLDGGLKIFRKLYKDMCSWEQLPILLSPTNEHYEADVEDVYNLKATEILPFIFLGNEYDAVDEKLLKSLGISKILNVTNHLPFPKSSDFECARLSASDSCNQDLRKYFEDAFTFIENARSSNSKVLVHCQAGISRSPSIVIAYLMKHSTLDFQEALQVVKEQRSIISPNFHFLGQLLEFERELMRGTIPRNIVLNDVELRKLIIYSRRPYSLSVSKSL